MIKLKNDKQQIESYLQKAAWLEDGENVSGVEIPGAGNMNFTLRVMTNKRTFIIKQSRAYVEKYPQVAAPQDRCQREAEFYNAIASSDELKKMTPDIIAIDKENNIISMEDLGAGSDFTYLYDTQQTIEDEDLQQIMKFAAQMHKDHKVAEDEERIDNLSMRKLNHEHMFVYPFMDDNGLNLDDILPGLSEASKKYKADDELKSAVSALGDRYLANGNTLLHGDYFPGSWLKTEDGIKVIDPEFCFHGYPEFEIGVCVAHLMMADQPVKTIFNAFKYYTSEAPLDLELCKQCAGVEMMRRIMGLAQLPLNIDLEKRIQLLETAHEYILNN
ncbi:phosphotransferase [Portibacter lacus]|uniref:Aminoglycoside phosphotransferase domain-containing protein n=1 Tax=Portibacter lacus TaxID=1099794 RepID=A0AA37SP77_9BACT|nr:phosphotransferase [Portibacter lacus]GLR16927.1 hypothetical protein GCM10007940_15420 [Portibacter lacus]